MKCLLRKVSKFHIAFCAPGKLIALTKSRESQENSFNWQYIHSYYHFYFYQYWYSNAEEDNCGTHPQSDQLGKILVAYFLYGETVINSHICCGLVLSCRSFMIWRKSFHGINVLTLLSWTAQGNAICSILNRVTNLSTFSRKPMYWRT